MLMSSLDLFHQHQHEISLGVKVYTDVDGIK